MSERTKLAEAGMARWVWENSLTLVLAGLFVLFLALQSVTGFFTYNDEQRDHSVATVSFGQYLTSGHFVEATGENWESEFLQMGLFVILTVFLRQKGSAESKHPYEEEEVDEDPRSHRKDADAPAAVRRGGWPLTLYSNSLSLAFLLLFLVSFGMHLGGGLVELNRDRLSHGSPPVAWTEYVSGSRFWFESFQNWQSEFLAVLSIVALSIFLRQWGSPQSKPVAEAHSSTGGG